MVALYRGWIWLEPRQLQWTGISGCPLFAGEFETADFGFGRGVGSADIHPVIAHLNCAISLDDFTFDEMDEAPTMIKVGAGEFILPQEADSFLAVGAEHLGGQEGDL